jgi:MFS family permease
MRSTGFTVSALGVNQILAWGSSYYLLTILARPIADDTGWTFAWVVGGLSVGLLVAALASPFVGRLIGHRGGRPVLAASAVLMAVGLVLLGVATSLTVFMLAWIVIGFGMGAGLYDAAFSTLGRLFGQAARSQIATVTLFGGLASTLCWPLTTYLLQTVGWRGACIAYAAIHLAVVLPLYLAALPRHPPRPMLDERPDRQIADANARGTRFVLTFALLALTITLASMISTMISVHLMTFLDARGVALVAAVALGTIIGPAQLGARFVELFVGKYHHPIWTHIVSTLFVALGLVLLWSHGAPIWLTLILYGAGIGLESIARATVPLVLFDTRHYASIMGKLACPSLTVQAAAPAVGAMLIQWRGSDGALSIIATAALINVLLVMVLLYLIAMRRERFDAPA